MGRRISAADGPAASVPREIFDRHMAIIGPIKADADEKRDTYRQAHASYRAALKHAKNDSVDVDALTEALKIQKEDPGDVARRFKNLNSYLVWLDIPIGTQLGFFPEDAAAAGGDEPPKGARRQRAGADADADEKPIDSTPATIARAYNDGHKAGAAGKNLGTCPYTSPKLHAEWERGWRDAQAEIAARLGPPTKAGDGKNKPKARKKRGAHAEPGLALQ